VSSSLDNIYLTPEHELLREQVARFIAREVEPHGEQWEREGCVPREVLRKLGAAGMLGLMFAPEHGGGGADALTNLVFAEALSRSTFGGFIVTVHSCTLTWRARTCTTPARQSNRRVTCRASPRGS
jgi:acyl-CoA dehydrogenase